jgi:hypothetical protein
VVDIIWLRALIRNRGIFLLNVLHKDWEAESNGKLQTKISHYIPKLIDEKRQAKLDKMFAFAIYKTGKPFTSFKDNV